MVPNPGAAARPDRLRPLNRPRPAVVLPCLNDGRPLMVVEGGTRRRVERIQDSWRIDDEWWREPISRRYYQVVLDDGALRTLYQDALSQHWYEQAY